MVSRKLLLALLLVGGLLFVGIFGWYWYPKTQTLSFSHAYTGYYRGLGLHDDEGFAGKNWFKIVVHEDRDGFWHVDVDRLGYNSYEGYYGNGTLREQGSILVKKNGDEIAALRHDVLNGKYYTPNGSLISEVKSGTGKQILCCPNGQPFWELELQNGKYAHLRMWTCSGQLTHESAYRNGEQHGESIGYYPNGQLKYAGQYKDGEKVGVWKHFTSDGVIESEQDFGNTPASEETTSPTAEGSTE